MPDVETAIDGKYPKTLGAIVDWPQGSYRDPWSEICEDCERAAAEAS